MIRDIKWEVAFVVGIVVASALWLIFWLVLAISLGNAVMVVPAVVFPIIWICTMLYFLRDW